MYCDDLWIRLNDILVTGIAFDEQPYKNYKSTIYESKVPSAEQCKIPWTSCKWKWYSHLKKKSGGNFGNVTTNQRSRSLLGIVSIFRDAELVLRITKSMTSAKVLAHFDPKYHWAWGIGAVLYHKYNGIEWPITYF